MSTKPFLRALAKDSLDTPPLWLMRQAGRYLPEYRQTRTQAGSFLDLCYTPDLAAEVTHQPLRRYGFDAAILFSDILMIPDALGQKVAFKEGEGPVLPPIRTVEDLKTLSFDHFHQTLQPVYETVSKLAATLPSKTALIGFCGAPWTVATYMIEGKGSKDFSHAKTMLWQNPKLFHSLMDLLTEAISQELLAQIKAGAEAIQLFDTWASALPETEFREWIIKPTQRIVQRLKSEYPHIPVLGFPRGAGALYEVYAKETGVDGLSLDSSVPLQWAAKTLQPVCCLQGNLDPLLLVAGGDAMNHAIDRILNTLGHGPFIFNLGHGIVPQTPPEHVAQLVQRVRQWYR